MLEGRLRTLRVPPRPRRLLRPWPPRTVRLTRRHRAFRLLRQSLPPLRSLEQARPPSPPMRPPPLSEVKRLLSTLASKSLSIEERVGAVLSRRPPVACRGLRLIYNAA